MYDNHGNGAGQIHIMLPSKRGHAKPEKKGLEEQPTRQHRGQLLLYIHTGATIVTYGGHGILVLGNILKVFRVVVLFGLAVVARFGCIVLVLLQQVCVVVLSSRRGRGGQGAGVVLD